MPRSGGFPSISPGQRLYEWILGRYTSQLVGPARPFWISIMSREFGVADLEEYLLHSTAMMMVRRLLANARWYDESSFDREDALRRFERDYLPSAYSLDRSNRQRLTDLVFEAYSASRKDIPSSFRRRLREQAAHLDQHCELCGREIDYAELGSDDKQFFSLDHIWPQVLGGLSIAENLRVTHRGCNEQRQNAVGASDTHYEHFHVSASYSDNARDSFWKQLNTQFRMAARLRADFQCERCEKPAPEMLDGIDYARLNADENYNIFNIQVLCKRHGAIRQAGK